MTSTSLLNRSRDEARAEPELLIHDEEERILRSLKMVARLMDDQFEIPGTGIRFGLDSVAGLVPAVGDLATAAISVWIVAQARRLGVSRWTTARMGWNVLVDTVLGAVPLVGDAFDFAWKSNRKNMALLEKHLARRREKRQPNWNR